MSEHKCSKQDWPDGPWMTEPDLMTGTDGETGYTYNVVRDPESGNLAVGVRIPRDHWMSGRDRSVDVEGAETVEQAVDAWQWGRVVDGMDDYLDSYVVFRRCSGVPCICPEEDDDSWAWVSFDGSYDVMPGNPKRNDYNERHRKIRYRGIDEAVDMARRISSYIAKAKPPVKYVPEESK